MPTLNENPDRSIFIQLFFTQYLRDITQLCLFETACLPMFATPGQFGVNVS